MNIQKCIRWSLVLLSLSFIPFTYAADLPNADKVTKVLIVINKNEIAAAKLAMNKSQNKQVKDYANMMEKQHTENLNETLKISKQLKIAPTGSKESEQLKQDGKKELATLKNAKKDFDMVYINNMIKDHESALNFLNQNINNNNNADLEKHLQNTKVAVEKHLEEAKEIQKTLNS
jgi:putative membrane protein